MSEGQLPDHQDPAQKQSWKDNIRNRVNIFRPRHSSHSKLNLNTDNKKGISRRDFLKATAQGAGALAVTGTLGVVGAKLVGSDLNLPSVNPTIDTTKPIEFPQVEPTLEGFKDLTHQLYEDKDANNLSRHVQELILLTGKGDFSIPNGVSITMEINFSNMDVASVSVGAEGESKKPETFFNPSGQDMFSLANPGLLFTKTNMANVQNITLTTKDPTVIYESKGSKFERFGFDDPNAYQRTETVIVGLNTDNETPEFTRKMTVDNSFLDSGETVFVIRKEVIASLEESTTLILSDPDFSSIQNLSKEQYKVLVQGLK